MVRVIATSNGRSSYEEPSSGGKGKGSKNDAEGGGGNASRSKVAPGGAARMDAFESGDHARLSGLKNCPQHNGAIVRLIAFDSVAARWEC